MHAFVKRGLMLSLSIGTLMTTAAGMASADATATGSTAENSGLLSGTNVPIAVNVPINICGVAVGILGEALADNDACGNVSGGTTQVPVQLPVNCEVECTPTTPQVPVCEVECYNPVPTPPVCVPTTTTQAVRTHGTQSRVAHGARAHGLLGGLGL